MLDKAKSLSEELIRLRRDFHHHPELSFQEVRTARLVAETLQEIGGIFVKPGVGKTGVVGEIALLGQSGLDYASAEKKYTLQSLPAEEEVGEANRTPQPPARRR